MEKKYPLISVIMPSYNSAGTVERAVMSVIAQTYPRAEVVVVDNSSQDDTAEVVQKLIGQYFYENEETGERMPAVRLIVQPNNGVSSARNAGIRAARGEYFVSLDADDFYEPETLMTLFEAAHPEDGEAADTVICGMRKVYEGEEERNEEFIPPRTYDGTLSGFLDEMLTELYDLHLIGTHSNKLYRTALVRDSGIFYNEELAVNEDIDFVMRYLAVCRRVSVIRNVFLNYVQHGKGQSLINTFQPHGLKGALLVLESCTRLLEGAGAGSEVRAAMDERMFVHICSFAGLMYYRSGYSDGKILDELRMLCADGEFKKLLGRLRPSGAKNRAAHFLLRHNMVTAYHLMCRKIYEHYD